MYPYDASCKPLYNVPIVTGATTVTDSITGNSFIMVINEALYYGKKLDHSLINTNQLSFYETNIWDNHVDLYRELCIETDDGKTIYMTPDGTNIRFSSQVPTNEKLITLPHIEVISVSEWNPSTVKLGKVSMYKNDDEFEIQRHVFGYHTKQTGKCSYSDNSTDEGVLHSINPVLVELVDKLKQNISEITTPAND